MSRLSAVVSIPVETVRIAEEWGLMRLDREALGDPLHRLLLVSTAQDAQPDGSIRPEVTLPEDRWTKTAAVLVSMGVVVRKTGGGVIRFGPDMSM